MPDCSNNTNDLSNPGGNSRGNAHHGSRTQDRKSVENDQDRDGHQQQPKGQTDAGIQTEPISIESEPIQQAEPFPAPLPSPAEEAKTQLSMYYEFKRGSELGKYIKKKVNNFRECGAYTLAEILTILKQVIKEELQYDVLNPSIIISSPEMEKAIDRKGLHVKDFKKLVLAHLNVLDSKQQNRMKEMVLPITIVSPDPPPISADNQQILSVRSSTTTTDGPTGQSKRRQHRRPTTAQIQQACRPPGYYADIRLHMSRETVNRGPRNVLEQAIYQNKASRFKLKKEFREALSTRPDLDLNKEYFSFEEATSLLSKYILGRKEYLFDPREIHVAFIMNDPLQMAFKVNAFHRCQVMDLLKNQLEYVSPEKIEEEEKNRTQKPQENKIQMIVSPFPSLAKAATVPATRSCVTAEVLDAALEAASARKRSNSGGAGPTKLARCEDGSRLAGTTSRSNQLSDQEGQTEELSDADKDTDKEVDDTDVESVSSEMYEVEYELETGDEQERPSQAGGGNEDLSTDEDSAVEDVVTHQVFVDKDEKAEQTRFADCESNDEDEENMKLKLKLRLQQQAEVQQQPAQIKPDGKFSCSNCQNSMPYRYKLCKDCWEQKRNWMPERPKPCQRSRRQRDRRQERRRAATHSDEALNNDSDKTTDDAASPPQPSGSSCNPDKLLSAHKALQSMSSTDSGQGSSEQQASANGGSSCGSGHSRAEEEEENDDTTPMEIDSKGMSSSSSTQEIMAGCSATNAAPDVSVSHSKSTTNMMSELQLENPPEKKMDLFEEFHLFLQEKLKKTSGQNGLPENPKLQKLLQEQIFSSEANASRPTSMLCMFCYQRPKDASLIHGKLGHQICCYPCAKRLWKKQATCPVCRRRIEKIVRVIAT